MKSSLSRFAARLLAPLVSLGVLGAAVPAHAQPIKIGSILSVTGPAAFLGEDMKAGMELAVEQINAAGGVGGRKIDWVFYDAESQTPKRLTATRRRQLMNSLLASTPPSSRGQRWCQRNDAASWCLALCLQSVRS